MVTDPIADFITQIKNASAVGQVRVAVPYSEFKLRVAELLKQEGYLAQVEPKGKKAHRTLEVELAYEADGSRKVHEVKRLSKPSRRIYASAKDLRPVRSGHGIVVLSTPEGVLSGSVARKKQLGGELLFEIW